MRTVVREIIEPESAEVAKLHGDIRHFMSYCTNERFLSEISHETEALAQALSNKR
jgi:hypothetical protein